jgi:tRNA(Arg) A34 adenosine deaminase TadA
LSDTKLLRRNFLSRAAAAGAACAGLAAARAGQSPQAEDVMTEAKCEELTQADLEHLRRSIELSELATTPEYGINNPFGAVLLLGDGRVLEGWNHTRSMRDPTEHAEMWLIRHAVHSLNLNLWGGDRPLMERGTLYASTEPCAMCAGAIYWSGIGRVVFGCSMPCIHAVMAGVLGKDADTGIGITAQEVLRTSGHPITVIGPCLEEEARRIHERYWPELLGRT